ncbi:MAG: DUF255 domain-containing protein [Bacteroidales bacterium]|nr:DUF255 domain-containing protein [Bacteroidales bacterium]
MNIRKYTLLFFFIFSILIIRSQIIVEPSPIKWFTVEQADSMFDKIPKPILIDIYTDWCGWCNHMMKTTFSNPGIASYINTNFYPVRFNAEAYDTIYYQNNTYINKGEGNKPKHDFAKFILNSRFSFPTIVYSDTKRNMYQIPGYMNIREIEPLLVYFSEEINYNVNYDDWKILYYFNYSANYKDEIKKTEKNKHPDTLGIINWKSFKEATESCLNDNKPMFIYFYSDWCQSCKITSGMVFTNTIIAKLLNENFHPVMFNAASQTDEIFFGQTLPGTGEGKPHKLVYALLQQSFKFPAFIIIDSKKQKLNEIHGFMLPYQTEVIINYFITGNYKKQKFNEFVKTFKGELNN